MQNAAAETITVQWRPCATPLVARIVQAILVSAAIAVVFQSLVNLAIDTAAMVLHITCFVAVFPLVWKWRLYSRLEGDCHRHFRGVRFTSELIEGELQSGDRSIGLQIEEVGQFWTAMVLRLRPIDTQSGVRADKAFDVLVWKQGQNKEEFRKIALLALWHARRGT
ncbi:hypothetical protein [Orrella daihaiensis]|uniref:Toxin CptA n=1 Tax=Orrella daihaiensis TaxID=2782176 RepID=A0ABY4AH40_9BURK|nr:hypothetical protein [Orrella daihaiensis]UOD49587.1 hypothetical protein DHf2319_08895 [Orrella daihaiensis]